jgi:uncharacterized delta-60 repeat protein
LSATTQTALTDFAKTDNVYTNLNEQFPHTGTGTPGSGVGTPGATFVFDPAPSAVAAAGYAPGYVAGSNAANNGITFTLTSDASGHDFDEINGGQTTTVPVNLTGVRTIYALMSAYDGQTFDATLTGADGTTATYSDVSLPDFNGGSVNTTGGNVADQTVFQVNDVGGGGTGNSTTGDTTNYGLTEVAFGVPADLSGQALASISFASHGYMTLLLAVTAVTPAASSSFDAAADFSTVDNPNGNWSYGERTTEAATFTPYPDDGALDVGPDVVGWHTAGSASPPYIGINTTTSPVTASTVVVPPGVLDMHPGPNGEYTDARFTAPVAGSATVAVTFTGVDVDGTTTDVHVLLNGASVADGEINGYGSTFAKSISLPTVAAGDTIDFIVGYGTGSYYSDSTTLSAQVTFGTAAPVKSIGGLDPGFGADGIASHDVGFTATTGVAADGAQSVLVGPIGAAPSESFGLTRYNADGTLDTTFGTAGVTATPFAGADAVPAAVAVLADGDIVVAGTATTYAADGVTVTGSQFAVAEYTPAGALDPSFGTGGTTTLQFATGDTDVLHALAIGPGGVIYLGGTANAGGAGLDLFGVAALTAKGSPDTAFGTGGTVRADVPGVVNGQAVVNGLAVQKNGALVAAGQVTSSSGTTEVALARFTKAGVLDRTFGTKGWVTDSVGGLYDAADSVALQANGAIVVGGLTATGSGASLSSDFLVQRYTAAGRPDRTFGTGGSVVTAFGQPAAVTQVIADADGTVIASGRTAATLAGPFDVAIARYTAQGKADTTFAGTGRVIISLSARTATPASLLAAVASSLGAAFDAFVGSSQGVVATTTGGEILAAGNSGADTVEAELVAAGVDLVAKLLSTLPASVLAGAKGTATVSVTESGTTSAVGSVTIQLQFATTATGAGAVSAHSFAERVNLRSGQVRSFKLAYAYPAGLAQGDYFLLATVTNGTGVPGDLNTANNTAASAAAVAVAPPFTALSGSDLTAASAFAPGKAATVSLDLTNAGNVTAKGKVTVAVYLSPDGTAVDGTQVASVPVTLGLSAGKGKATRLRFTLAAGAATGTFTLVAVVDPANGLGNDTTAGDVVVGPTVTVG